MMLQKKQFRRTGFRIFAAVFLLALLFVPAAGRAQAAANRVFDEYDLLTADEEAALQSSCETFADTYGMNIFVMTVGYTQVPGEYDSDTIHYIEDVAEQAVGGDYIGLIINWDTRFAYIDVYGSKALKTYTDKKQTIIFDEVMDVLGSGSVSSACSRFVQESGRMVNYDPNRGLRYFMLAAAGVLSLFVSFGMYRSALSRHHEKRRATNADYLIDAEALQLSVSRDDFINRFVTSQPRPQQRSSGGGGHGTTTHTSHSGGTHSGHGGHF